MKHKIQVMVPVEKRGLFDMKKTVMEPRMIEVDDKSYQELKKKRKPKKQKQDRDPETHSSKRQHIKLE